jgi:hypothetical protein
MLDEKLSFVTREFLRTMRDEHLDLDAAFGRLNQRLSPGMRHASDRLRAGLASNSGDAQGDWLRVTVRSAQLAREHGGTIAPGVWTELEEHDARCRSLSSTLAQSLVRTLILSVTTLLLATIVGVIYVVFVLPQFVTLFESLHAELPRFTRLVLGGLQPLILLLPVVAVFASAFLLPVRPTWQTGKRVWQLAPLGRRVRIGREFVLRYRQQLFIAFASALTQSGLQPRTALKLASHEAQLYADENFAADSPATHGDTLLAALADADRCGHLREEIMAQRAIRADALLLAAERLQFEFSFVVRGCVYALITLLLVAMYLPIFKIGAAV